MTLNPYAVKTIVLSSGERLPRHKGRNTIGLCEAVGPACEHLAYVYKLEGGRTYWDGYVQNPQHTPLRVIYSRS